jgi:hypothetical protein
VVEKIAPPRRAWPPACPMIRRHDRPLISVKQRERVEG